MFREIYNGLLTTTQKNNNEYRLLVGAFLAPANPIKLLIINYLSFVFKGLDKLFTRKNK